MRDRAQRPMGPPFVHGRRELDRAGRSIPSRAVHLSANGRRERSCAGQKTPQRVVRSSRPTRSHFSLVANRRRGSVNRSPQGAIRGGFAVSPQNSGRFPRCACCGSALARARRERRASSMSAPWDSSPALSPVPWGERSREAFNCVPGDQQSAPLINSFGVRDGAEPVDHRGDGSRGATNGARLAWGEPLVRGPWSRASSGLLIVGAPSQRHDPSDADKSPRRQRPPRRTCRTEHTTFSGWRAGGGEVPRFGSEHAQSLDVKNLDV